jgi:hypothetical protein
LWVSTLGGGMNLFDQKTNTFRHFVHNAADKNSVSDNNVNYIFEDADNNFWIGTESGLNLFNRAAGTFTLYANPFGKQGNSVKFIQQDKKGNLWLGTSYAGVIVFNFKQNTFRQYKHQVKDKSSLSGDVLGSFSGGLLYLHAMAETTPPIAPVINLLLMQKNTFPIRLHFSAAFDQSNREFILNRWRILNAAILSPEDNFESHSHILVSFKTKNDLSADQNNDELAENDILISLFNTGENCWDIEITGKNIKQLTQLPVEVLLKTSYSKVLIKDNQIIKGWNHALQREEA